MRTYYVTNDGRYVTDLSPLWAVIGKRPLLLSDAEIESRGGLPVGWRWIEEHEWSALEATLSRLTPEQAFST